MLHQVSRKPVIGADRRSEALFVELAAVLNSGIWIESRDPFRRVCRFLRWLPVIQGRSRTTETCRSWCEHTDAGRVFSGGVTRDVFLNFCRGDQKL